MKNRPANDVKTGKHSEPARMFNQAVLNLIWVCFWGFQRVILRLYSSLKYTAYQRCNTVTKKDGGYNQKYAKGKERHIVVTKE